MRFMLPFRAQDELEPLVGCVERAMARAFQRIQPELLTRIEREMRTEKLTSVKLILFHSLPHKSVSVKVSQEQRVGVW